MRLTSLLKKVPKTHLVQVWVCGKEGKYPITFIDEREYIQEHFGFDIKGKDIIEVDVDFYTDLNNINWPFLKLLTMEVSRHDSR